MRRPDHVWSSVEGNGPHHRRWRVVWHDHVDERREPCGASRAIGGEWNLFGRSTFGVGWRLTWGTAASETTPDIAVHLGRLGSAWLSFEQVFPARWFARRKPDGSPDWSREIGFLVDAEHVEWSMWVPKHESRWDIPSWRRVYARWDRLLFGRTEHESTIETEGTCVVPLPEGPQPATFRTTKVVMRWSRPLGRCRDRLLGPRTRWHTDIRPGRPSPIPGKGENSWDLDDDAVYSTSAPGRSVEEAIGHHVATVLRQRRRYGGQHMSIPPDADGKAVGL
jgi:hypothetical protein